MPEETETKEEAAVEIAETPEVKEDTFTTEGLTDGEVKLAEEHGLIKEEKKEEKEEEKEEKEEEKDGEHEEQPEPETKEDTKQEEDKHPTFDDVEKDEGNLKKYNKNEQALYWKWKSDKRKKQKAVKEFEDIRAEYELSQVKDSVSRKRLKQIDEILDGEEPTVEKIKAILNRQETEEEVEEVKKEVSKKEKKEDTAEDVKERQERIHTAEQIGKTKYDNFEDITKWATEIVELDKTGLYRGILEASFSDKNLDESELIERVVNVARLNPNFGKEKSEETESKEKDTKADRAIKNSKKKVSSASVSRGGSKRVISHDDLTPDDAEKLTKSQWQELPEKVRDRILRES